MNTALVFYYCVGISATLAVAGVGFFLMLRYGQSIPNWLLVMLLIFPAYMFVAQYLKFQSLHMYADFSHWLQIVQSIAHGWSAESLSADFLVPGIRKYFAVHFVPLIYVFGIIYKLFSFPEILLLLNGVIMYSSVVPLYLLAKRLVHQRFAILCAVLFLWYPTFQYITMYEFEMLRFSIPIILWMLYTWELRRPVLFVVFAILALLVREEVSLVIAFFGLYVLFVERRRLWGAGIAGVAFTYFAAVVTVIMGAFSPADRYTYTAITGFSELGTTPFEVVRNVLLHPISGIIRVFHPIKVANVFMYGLPLLFVPLLAPLALISAIPNVSVGLLSSSVTNSSFMLYYLAPSIPFLFYAFLKAWPRAVALRSRFPGGVPLDRWEHALMGALCLGVLSTNVFFGPSPISLQFWSRELRPAPFRTQDFHWSAYHVTDHHRKVEAFVARIPDDAIVSAEQFLAPRLFRKRGTMIFPQLESVDGVYRADYVLLDKANPVKTGVATVPGSYDGLRQDPQFYYDWVERFPGAWERIAADDGYFLYRRITDAERS